jgi:DNA end-binding protein Ku
MRSIGSATIAFGLLNIPTKLYSSAVAEKAAFHLINKTTGNRLKQLYVDAGDQSPVDKDNTLKGFEYIKDKCVTFTSEELKLLEGERSGMIDLKEFIPQSTVNHLAIEKSYYLGPDKGADKAYVLLAQTMVEKSLAAIGRWSTRGKDELVLVHPHMGGLVLHQMFYVNETRSFDEVLETIKNVVISDAEKDLAKQLVDQLTSEKFDASKYKDEYVERVFLAVQQKVAGKQEIAFNKSLEKVLVIDLMEALKNSIKVPAKKKKKA